MTTLRAVLSALLVVGTFGVAIAKLPPPSPLTDEQKAAAEAKKAKDAVAAEAAKAAQARAEDRVAARYFSEAKAQGKTVAAPQMPASTPAATAPAKPVAPAAKAAAPVSVKK